MRKTIRAWDQQLTNMNVSLLRLALAYSQEWQYDVLLDVSHKLNEHLRHMDSAEDGASSEGDHGALSNSARFLRSIDASALGRSGWSEAVWPGIGLGALALSGLGIRRILRRRAHAKVQ